MVMRDLALEAWGIVSLARQAVWREGGASWRISHYYATHYH